MNGGPFAPLQAPRAHARPLRPVKGMTILRLAVLEQIEDATEPLEFEGRAKSAATWLVKNGFAGRSGGAYYALSFRRPAHELEEL